MGTGEVLSTTGGGHLPGIWAPVHVTGAQKVGAGPAPGGAIWAPVKFYPMYDRFP